MRFLTGEQCTAWCKQHDVSLADLSTLSSKPGWFRRRYLLKELTDPNYYSLANLITTLVEPFERCLLWVTSTGIWPSRENLHLYYRLRQSNGDFRLAEEAPGHLFLGHERAEMASFVFLGLLAGWDMSLFSSFDYARVLISHDGFVELASDDAMRFEAIGRQLEQAT
jgi:hypothetical protein